MKSMNGVVFTAINIEDLADLVATRLEPRIAETVRENSSDEYLTLVQSAKLIGKTTETIRNYIKTGKLKNYGTGFQRPKLSRREVVEFKRITAK
jgi:dTDP-4-dehydrorhamnose reductase